jgi:hypothetical protein
MERIKQGIVALIAMLCIWAVQAAEPYRFGDDPAWYVAEPVPASAADAVGDIRYLRVDDTTDLMGAIPHWHRRVVYEVVAAQALADAGQIAIGFQPAYQHVQLHALRIQRHGQWLDLRDQAHIAVLRPERERGSGLLNGELELDITLPDLRVGDRVEYRYSVVGRNPSLGAGFYDGFRLRYKSSLAARRIVYRYPQALPLHWRLDTDGFEVVDSASGPGERRLVISANAIPAVEAEKDAPDDYDGGGTLQVSTAQNWGEVARWATPLYPARLQDAGWRTTMRKELAPDPADAVGSLLRAVAFVQGQIRYTGLEMGDNAYRPYSPETVLKRRFGDCKDKAQLLIALLHEAGIAAEPVLVNTRRREAMNERLPSPQAFDHVVVRAYLPGRTVWIDPTRDEEVGALAERDPLPFRSGLPVAADSQDLVAIDYPFPAEPQVDVQQLIELVVGPENIKASFHVHTDYLRGRAAQIRANFADRGARRIGEDYLDYMQGFYSGMEQVDVPTLSSPVGVETGVDERYRVHWSHKTEGSTFGIVLFQLLDGVPQPSARTRQAPYALSGPRWARQQIRTRFVEGGWSIKPERDIVENAYFQFHRQVAVEGRDLVITGEWRRLADAIPGSALPAVRDDFARARELMEYRVDLDPPSVWERIGWRALLWPALALLSTMVLVTLLFLLRRRWVYAQALFHPRELALQRVQHKGWRTGYWVLVLGVLAGMLIEELPEYLLSDKPGGWLALPRALFEGGLWWVLGAWLAMTAFRILGSRIVYRDALLGSAWLYAPLLVLTPMALLATGGELRMLAEAFEPEPAQLPGMFLAGVLIVVAGVWAVCMWVGMFAGLAQVSRSRAFTAMWLTFAGAVLIAAPFLALAMIVRT